MQRELWRDIAWYEWLYQVSNLGRIKSLSRKSFTWHNLEEKILSQQKNYKWYLSCQFWLVHRIVAQAFIVNINNHPYINHIDGNKENNCKNNLEWCTATQNMLHSYRVLKRKTNSEWMIENNPMLWKTGALCPNSKTVYQYSLDGELIKEWWGTTEAAKILWITQQCISKACNGLIKWYKWYQWSYEKHDRIEPYKRTSWNKKQ